MHMDKLALWNMHVMKHFLSCSAGHYPISISSGNDSINMTSDVKEHFSQSAETHV